MTIKGALLLRKILADVHSHSKRNLKLKTDRVGRDEAFALPSNSARASDTGVWAVDLKHIISQLVSQLVL